MSRFAVTGCVGMPTELTFGPLPIHINNFGLLAFDGRPESYGGDLALEYVRLALPGIVKRYKAETGLLRFGNSRSQRRLDLLAYVAAALNEGA